MDDSAGGNRDGATTWIGRSRRRVEDARLLTGAGRYVGDHHPPDCLHVAFVRSAHAQAVVKAIDCARARTQAGVVAVFTGDDVRGLGHAAVNRLLPEMPVVPFDVLAHGKVGAVGQPVAAVVAERAELALDAADLIDIAYGQVDPPSADTHATFSQRSVAGDVDGAFAGAAVVATAEIAYARLAAMPLEPRNALAAWDAATQRLTTWLSTQTPHRARSDLAAILGLAEGSIRVIAPDVGGAFGGKASLFPEDAFVAWAAIKLGRPVKWHGSRGEDLLAGTHGRGAVLAGEMAFAADGSIRGLRARLDFPWGHWMPYSAAVPGRNTARILPGPYAVEALDIRLQMAPSSTAAVGIYRGAGRPEAAMLMERLIDLGARRLGLDPLDVRRRNRRPSHRQPAPQAGRETPDSGSYDELLTRAASLADYPGIRRRQAARRGQGELVGIGLALYVEPCGQGWESAKVELQPDGSIRASTGSTAQGQGRETAFAQIVADALGLPPDRVAVVQGDTDNLPSGIGALASRSTAIGGSALLHAAEELRTRAVTLVGAPDGQALDWTGVAAAAARGGRTLAASATFHAPTEAWSSGCVVARVAIDRDTGVPTIEQLAWVDDAGVVINPLLAQGQLVGGMAQGVGEALMERIVYDEHGQLLTGSLMDYALPRATDMPPIVLDSVVTPSPSNALGAKGVGEAGCIGVPAAIANAILDALAPFGVQNLELPLTSERIWRAMQAHHGDRP